MNPIDTPQSVSLIITTYNWHEALYLILKSILRQSKMPDEIIIADDGSDSKTKKVIDSFRDKITIPIIHVWHEDKGFRKAKILNRAIAKSSCEYIVQIDGDCLLHKHFIKDHLKFSKKNCFAKAYRVLLLEKISRTLLKEKKINFNLIHPNVKDFINGVRCLLYTRLMLKKTLNPHRIHGCNFAYWKADIIKVNGYEADLEGWGREDEELAIRFTNNNIYKIKIKNASIVYHLYHKPEDKKNVSLHISKVNKALKNKKKKAKNGIIQIS